MTVDKRVLLLLDVQVCNLCDPPKGAPSAAVLRTNIFRVLTIARSAKPPPRIIHVRNCGEPGEPDEMKAPGWQLFFPPLVHEHVVDKLKNNAFAGTRLAELISPEAEIVVVGLGSDFSVRATCSVALDRGNEVILIRGAHGTYDRVEVLHGGGITPAFRIEAEVEAELEEAGVLILDMKDVQGIFTDR
ncbi:hypothetical protein DFJ43DRAFT_1102507 [Lentinula guzmanii]|uniref:Isochorismatase-like domain-containing protein n=3 Tax=Lentinula TaxID=5352 RepID=A0AA38J2Y8_9AGAR|nr:hypothetical protein DFJ43DRAFT_1102507 [Lentinula guzmanii]KAJ3743879.1 hypothetical protein DFH05DRAFT_1128579 [Lentinula detonsa]KAJ3787064.1 hypothetical protein GGU10DRAFT_309824 [Lentinula aff. detonsa]KAJ3794705.1 hypothetical protein GGU11DRAFT_282495 [Lentinula aff. detonsa]